MIDRDLVRTIRARFRLEWVGIHGAPHWARVRMNGLRLAEVTGGNPRVIELFAFLHDVDRHNDDRDPAHGFRSARLVSRLDLGLDRTEVAQLVRACRYHSEGMLTGDATVVTCWDADRLDLWRVGVVPDPRFLCTPAARAWAAGPMLAEGPANER